MSSSLPTSPTVFATPSTAKKYSVPDAEHSYFYIPPCKTVVQSEKPLTVYVQRDESDGLEIEWVQHSWSVALLYALVTILNIAYYATCFVFQYGDYSPRVKSSVFDEPFLTRVVIVQWLVLLSILTSSVFVYRRLFMPLYIYLAIMATNGTLVLFVLRVKQVVDERITIMDIPLNMLGLLLFCAVLHDIVYFYAMHLKLVESRGFVEATRVLHHPTSQPNAYSTIHSSRFHPDETTAAEVV